MFGRIAKNLSSNKVVALTRSSGWLIVAFLGFHILTVGVYSFYRNNFFSFDEANGLRISILEPNQIIEALSYEQNSPVYYLLSHVLLNATGIIGLKIFNFLVWMGSLYILNRILHHLGYSRPTSLLYTAVFSTFSSLFHYAYYLRPYGLLVLLALLSYYYFLRYLAAYQKKYMALVSILCALQVALHPLSVITTFIYAVYPLVVGLLARVNNYKGKYLIRYWSFVLLPGVVLLALLLSKKSAWAVYLGHGVGYFQLFERLETAHKILTLFFNNLDMGAYLGVVPFAVLGYLVIRRVLSQGISREYYPGFIAFILYLLAILLFTGYQARHFLVLLPLIYIFLLPFFEEFTRTHSAPIMAILCILFTISFIFVANMIKSEVRLHKTCQALQNSSAQYAVTDIATFHVLDYCMRSDAEIAVLSNGGLLALTRNDHYANMLYISEHVGSLDDSFAVMFTPLPEDEYSYFSGDLVWDRFVYREFEESGFVPERVVVLYSPFKSQINYQHLQMMRGFCFESYDSGVFEYSISGCR